MKFIDSIHDEGVNPFIEMNKDGALLKRCDELLAEYTKAYDDAVFWVLLDYQNLQQMDTNPMLMHDPFLHARSREDHEKYELFLYTCHEQLLFCMDLVTAYKYLIQAETDWDYRYFARKIYLLMHESKQMFDNHGLWMQDAKKFLLAKDYEELDKIRKKLKTFFKQYDESDMEFVRHKIEAHRDKYVFNQIRAVQHLSVKRSAMIIQESFDIMVEYARYLIPMIGKMVDAIHRIYV